MSIQTSNPGTQSLQPCFFRWSILQISCFKEHEKLVHKLAGTHRVPLTVTKILKFCYAPNDALKNKQVWWESTDPSFLHVCVGTHKWGHMYTHFMNVNFKRSLHFSFSLKKNLGKIIKHSFIVKKFCGHRVHNLDSYQFQLIFPTLSWQMPDMVQVTFHTQISSQSSF